MQQRSILIPGLAALVAFAILIGLGTWQLARLHWKEALIATVQQRVAEPPAALPPLAEWKNLDLSEWEYRPVTLKGRFWYDREAYVYTLLSDPKGKLEGPGYWVMTPLQIDGGGNVIVNRGFIPLDHPEMKVAQTNGEVEIRGLLRGPEERNMFTPDDFPAKSLFYARDAAAISAGMSFDAAPFTIDALETPPGGLPQAGETRMSFPNRHWEYALTWYGLAASLVAVMAGLLWSRRRRAAS
ncbi:SURF1 family protein [Flaviflagellibacter deserti]|uniref:SURF1-like protein n=1 Tax=Flaviflagellibacter deserti TaxID=2267266 RepID=A0ABV9YWV6_9HYPH